MILFELLCSGTQQITSMSIKASKKIVRIISLKGLGGTKRSKALLSLTPSVGFFSFVYAILKVPFAAALTSVAVG